MGYLYVLSVNFTFIVIDTANVHLFIGTARGVGRGRDLVAIEPPLPLQKYQREPNLLNLCNF